MFSTNLKGVQIVMKKTRLRETLPRAPKLRFSPTAWAKLLYVRDAGDTEIGGFGVMCWDDPLFVEDLALVAQFCTAVHVEFEDNSVADYSTRMVDVGRRPEHFGRIWVHTHPGNSAQPSGTDELTFARVFGRSDWAVMFILARGGQTIARIALQRRASVMSICQSRSPNSHPFAASDERAWQAEYTANVQLTADTPPPKLATQRGSIFNAGDEELSNDWNEPWMTIYSEARMDSTETSADRFVRQQQLVPRDQLAGLRITVIGIGAIGRQVSLQLASIGVRQMQLVDFDTVELSNVTTQGYFVEDIGAAEVVSTARAVARIDPAITMETVRHRFRPKYEIGRAVFCCVDRIQTRESIWRSVANRVEFFADGRMLGETMRVLIVAGNAGRDYYPSSLFPASEAQSGSCTARSTVYTANIAAGLMVHQFVAGFDSKPRMQIRVLIYLPMKYA